MTNIFLLRVFGFQSDNLESKTCPVDRLRACSEPRRWNKKRPRRPKWIRIVAIGVTFGMCAAEK